MGVNGPFVEVAYFHLTKAHKFQVVLTQCVLYLLSGEQVKLTSQLDTKITVKDYLHDTGFMGKQHFNICRSARQFLCDLG